MESENRVISSAVPAGSVEQRLDVYLSSRFSYQSRTSWQREISDGRIVVNGIVITVPGKKVRPGDMISYQAEEYEEPEIDLGYQVIFEDEHFLAVNKSGNLPVHPSGVFFRNTLVMVLEQDLGGRFYPVHRLDRETSGAILFAKNAGAASLVQRDFGNFSKSYRAIVAGVPGESGFVVDVPIGTARNSLVRKKREAYPGAPEESRTIFRVISSSAGHSFLEAVPVTGRMHQIRVHLKFAGYPIVGDKLYGDDEKVYLDYVEHGLNSDIIARAGFTRCALHSYSIGFVQPYTGVKVLIEAALPADMQGLLERCDLTLQ